MNIMDLRACYNPVTQTTLFGFGNSNKFKVHNNISRMVEKEVNIGAYLMDSILPYKIVFDYGMDYNRGYFYSITYDRYTNGYINIYRPGNDYVKPSDIPSQYPSKEVSILQYIDSEFNLVGEGIIPETYWDNMQPAFTKYIAFNHKETLNRKKIVFDVVEPEFVPTTLDAFRTKVKDMMLSNTVDKSAGYESYLNTLPEKTLRKHYLVMHHERSCPSCVSAFIQYYQTNREALEKANVGIILFTTNKSFLLNRLGIANLPGNLVIDDSGNYYSHIGEITHIDWLTLDNKGKVISVENYESAMMYEVYSKINALIKD